MVLRFPTGLCSDCPVEEQNGRKEYFTRVNIRYFVVSRQTRMKSLKSLMKIPHSVLSVCCKLTSYRARGIYGAVTTFLLCLVIAGDNTAIIKLEEESRKVPVIACWISAELLFRLFGAVRYIQQTSWDLK